MVQDFIAGIDIGGTKIAAAIAREGGEIIGRESFRTEADLSPNSVVSHALDTVKRLAESHDGRLAAIGIGCPGPLDLERGCLLSPPNMPRSWRNFPLRDFVEQESGLPVVVENDANAAALGEHLYGAGRGYSDLVYLTISTGIGGGIIADNKLVHREGEAGHVTVKPDGALCGCGARGCLEAECSGTAIARRAREYLAAGRQSKLPGMVSDIEQVTAKMVTAAAREGDELACALWRETISLMAVGIGGIIALLAPQAVILGGGVTAGAGDLLLQPLSDELLQRVHIVSMSSIAILQAGLGAESGLYGALALGSRAVASSHSHPVSTG
jgi:glucokinase